MSAGWTAVCVVAAMLLASRHQDDAARSDVQWKMLALEKAQNVRELPTAEHGPLVDELELLHSRIEERREQSGADVYQLDQGLVGLADALSQVDEELLSSARTRDDWVRSAKEAALRTRRAPWIAVAFWREAVLLRDRGQGSEALAVIAAARAHIAAIPAYTEAIYRAAQLAETALARAQLAGEETDVLRMLGRFDDALAAIDAADEELAEAEREGLRQARMLADAGAATPPWIDGARENLAALRARFRGRRFEILLDLGLLEPARRCLLEEQDFAGEAGTTEALSTVELQRAHLAFYSGAYDDAERICSAAAERPWYARLAREGRAIFDWLRAKSRDQREWIEQVDEPIAAELLEALIHTGDLRGAERLYALATLARNRLRANAPDEARPPLAEARAQLAAEGRDRDTLDYAFQIHWLTALEADLALLEGAPREELLAARTRLEASTLEFLRKWSAVRPRAGGLGFLQHGRRSGSIGALLDVVLATAPAETAAEEALVWALRALAQGSLSRRLAQQGGDAPELELADVRRELLAARGGMLIYVVGEEESHVFAVDHERVRVARALPRHELDVLREALLERLRRPPDGPARRSPMGEPALVRAARELGAALVPAELWACVRTWEELSVHGLSTLGYVPMEALALEDGLLGDRLAIDYPASPRLALQLLERERETGRSTRPARELLLFAAPEQPVTEPASKRPLPWNEELEASLLAPYPSARAYTGADASWTRLADELRTRPPAVLQLVVHGLPVREVELFRRLLLSPAEGHDGFVGPEDVLDLRAPELVILSSCGAGQGRSRPGDDGIDDFGGTFLLAGAACVVVSVHDIHFEATMALSAVAHDELARGRSTARALLAARRALARHPDYAHPTFRTLVHAVGLGHRPVIR